MSTFQHNLSLLERILGSYHPTRAKLDVPRVGCVEPSRLLLTLHLLIYTVYEALV